MASVQQGEKQLFEKFWRGTFKAVATPRPESIIVASITARKPLPRTEPQNSPVVPARDGPSEKLGQHLATDPLGTNSWERDKACRELGAARGHSASHDKDLTPPPSSRGKKKKKKSTRKKRRRSSSYSPSPVKKKKKKSSKKHKRRRSFSKKRRHSSSSPKSKRRDEKRHKKQSRSRPRKSHRHRHHRCPSRSQSSESRPSSCESRHRGRSPEEGQKSRRRHSRRCSKTLCKDSPEAQSSRPPNQPLQMLGYLSARGVITGSGSAADLFTKTASPLTTSRGRSQEYDSGNDTSSPPSTQTSSARSRGQEKGSPSGGLSKSRELNSGNTSDSGNSFTTSSPQNKGAMLENLSPTSRGRESRGFQSPCLECAEVKKSGLVPSTARGSPMKGCSRSSSYASTRSSSHSSRSPNPRASPRYTQSRSTSSEKRSYSRSPSYSSKSGKRSPPSRSSRSRRSPSYSRYSPSSTCTAVMPTCKCWHPCTRPVPTPTVLTTLADSCRSPVILPLVSLAATCRPHPLTQSGGKERECPSPTRSRGKSSPAPAPQ
ncbi:serine/arginine repetitive matrix protein 4 isoform X2 [Macaca fascicularis]|uniref:serine/arginine repetitive matrix protein 4 isoform X2 n=1 Tax=Macaca fascicularis TaxID=9541 RepID=UPI0032B08B23